MFLDEDFYPEFNSAVIYDEAAYSAVLTEDMEYVDFLMEELSSNDKQFRQERDEIRGEIETINDTLEEDRADISKLKRSWNRILAIFSSVMAAASVGGAAAVTTKKGWSLGKRAGLLIPLGVVVGVISRIVSKMFKARAQKRDIETMRKDIEKVKQKITERMAKDKANKKMYEANIQRLDALLERMEKKEDIPVEEVTEE